MHPHPHHFPSIPSSSSSSSSSSPSPSPPTISPPYFRASLSIPPRKPSYHQQQLAHMALLMSQNPPSPSPSQSPRISPIPIQTILSPRGSIHVKNMCETTPHPRSAFSYVAVPSSSPPSMSTSPASTPRSPTSLPYLPAVNATHSTASQMMKMRMSIQKLQREAATIESVTALRALIQSTCDDLLDLTRSPNKRSWEEVEDVDVEPLITPVSPHKRSRHSTSSNSSASSSSTAVSSTSTTPLSSSASIALSTHLDRLSTQHAASQYQVSSARYRERFCRPCTFIESIPKEPLRTIMVKIEKQYTLSSKETRHMSATEKSTPVQVPIRIMADRSQCTTDRVFFVAKDVCLLIHTRKGNVAKSIGQFNDSEKARMPVLCPRSNGAISTHILTVLSMAGVTRLLRASRSPLAPRVLQWITTQVDTLVHDVSLGDPISIIEDTSMWDDDQSSTTRRSRVKDQVVVKQEDEDAETDEEDNDEASE